jgi:hypothetical protein
MKLSTKLAAKVMPRTVPGELMLRVLTGKERDEGDLARETRTD